MQSLLSSGLKSGLWSNALGCVKSGSAWCCAEEATLTQCLARSLRDVISMATVSSSAAATSPARDTWRM
jgi:hypothetical protein